MNSAYNKKMVKLGCCVLLLVGLRLPLRLWPCPPKVVLGDGFLLQSAKLRLPLWVSFQIQGGLNTGTLLGDGRPPQHGGSFPTILQRQAVRGANWLAVGLRAMEETQSVTPYRIWHNNNIP